MSSNILRIEINFPVRVEVTNEEEMELTRLIDRVCKRNSNENQTLWTAGIGSKITYFPIMEGDGPIEFDDDTFCIDVGLNEK